MKKIFTLLAGSLALAIQSKAQLTIGNMEQWRTYNSAFTSLEAPQGWYGLDSTAALFALTNGKKQVIKSTDAHAGTYAAKLLSHAYGGQIGTLPGIMSNAKISINITDFSYTLSGGLPVTQRVTEARAWIKYMPKSTADSGTILAAAVLQGRGVNGTDSIVGAGSFVTGPVGSYTQVSVPITYINGTVVPDHFQIGFASNYQRGGADSSQMLVDDVVLVGVTGITQALFNNKVVSCYPNPASNVLYLHTDELQPLTWETISPNGQLLTSQKFVQTATVPLNNFPAGLYFYRVLNKDMEIIQTGKFSVK